MKTTTDAAKLAGITYRQLDHWITNGYVKLSDPNPGSGNPRTLSSSQLAILLRMGELVRLGIAPEAAAKIARALRLAGVAKVGQFTIVENT